MTYKKETKWKLFKVKSTTELMEETLKIVQRFLDAPFPQGEQV